MENHIPKKKIRGVEGIKKKLIVGCICREARALCIYIYTVLYMYAAVIQALWQKRHADGKCGTRNSVKHEVFQQISHVCLIMYITVFGAENQAWLPHHHHPSLHFSPPPLFSYPPLARKLLPRKFYICLPKTEQCKRRRIKKIYTFIYTFVFIYI